MSKRKEKLSAFRDMSDEELRKKVEELKRELFLMRMSATREGKVNPGRMREIKKDIARIFTILREREIQRQKQERS